MYHQLTSSDAIKLREISQLAQRAAIDLIVELGNDSKAQGMVASAFLTAAITLLEHATDDEDAISEMIVSHRRIARHG